MQHNQHLRKHDAIARLIALVESLLQARLLMESSPVMNRDQYQRKNNAVLIFALPLRTSESCSDHLEHLNIRSANSSDALRAQRIPNYLFQSRDA